jgi:hypothetical protein
MSMPGAKERELALILFPMVITRPGQVKPELAINKLQETNGIRRTISRAELRYRDKRIAPPGEYLQIYC